MTIEELREQQLIIFEVISGSRAYGTNLPHSDTDLRGVFMMPQSQIYGLNRTEQAQNTTNDIVFYELGKFMEMLGQNNPNIMELLNIPADCVVYKHPIFDLILSQKEKFITTKCQYTFGSYAAEQIKKARGLNKKIVQSFEKERKTPLHFCFIIDKKGYGSEPFINFLAENNYEQEKCGLVKIPNMRDMYAVFYDKKDTLTYKGIVQSDDSNELSLSSVPEGEMPIAILFYSKDSYSIYCKDYKHYWEWVEKRNPDRFSETMLHGKGYDGKNLMHCHRLLDMCIEIGEGKGIIVRRPNREQLLEIRRGSYDYDKLIAEAESKVEQIEAIYKKSTLPHRVDMEFANDLLLQMRELFYQK
ncbi:MAG: nucleotidyltransferase [Cytophagales bacterium]|nr:MAG: nucleotidyltransferase [Cytophagales bacterium]